MPRIVVLLREAGGRGWQVFQDPARVLIARTPEQVGPCLAGAQREVDGTGCWAHNGFVRLEAHVERMRESAEYFGFELPSHDEFVGKLSQALEGQTRDARVRRGRTPGRFCCGTSAANSPRPPKPTSLSRSPAAA